MYHAYSIRINVNLLEIYGGINVEFEYLSTYENVVSFICTLKASGPWYNTKYKQEQNHFGDNHIYKCWD